MQIILKQLVVWILDWLFMKGYRAIQKWNKDRKDKKVAEEVTKELKDAVNKPNPTDKELKDAAEKYLNS